MGQKRNPSLPTTSAGRAFVRGGRGVLRGKQVKKTFNSIKITVLCDFMTIIFLRGTIGIGNLIEETNRILTEIRSESDPTEPDTNPNATYTLGPKISNWDTDRQNWLEGNPEFPSHVNGKSRVLLLTGSQPNPCDNPIGDHYLLKVIKNKIDYCRIHGIEIVYTMAHLDKELAGYWGKVPMIRRVMLSHPEAEWIWWMDSDALFTDMVFEIPLSKYTRTTIWPSTATLTYFLMRNHGSH
ncbi:hypothetical protein SAY87_006438 [Trapa incisa]|uniref:Uncharacterized protein n=1 Tax=Trapa incisa TaxID=236973 RepID=A0AAN7JYN4_9MYRT|nr:hypothetical protein SAY87_006438 [Trapa incisa]